MSKARRPFWLQISRWPEERTPDWQYRRIIDGEHFKTVVTLGQVLELRGSSGQIVGYEAVIVAQNFSSRPDRKKLMTKWLEAKRWVEEEIELRELAELA